MYEVNTYPDLVWLSKQSISKFADVSERSASVRRTGDRRGYGGDSGRTTDRWFPPAGDGPMMIDPRKVKSVDFFVLFDIKIFLCYKLSIGNRKDLSAFYIQTTAGKDRKAQKFAKKLRKQNLVVILHFVICLGNWCVHIVNNDHEVGEIFE